MRKEEDKLRRKIKRNLESVKEPEERIIDKHGNNEFGLDLIILKFDAFRGLRAYGVQVKTGNIRCSGKATQRIKEIIGQLSIAFGNRVQVDGKDYKLDGLYLVTNGEFLGNAEDYIRAACVGIRNVHFIGGQLLNQFNDWCQSNIDQYKET